MKRQDHIKVREKRRLEKIESEYESEYKVLEEEVEKMSSSNSLKIRQEREKERKKKLEDLDARTSDIQVEIELRGKQRDELEKRVEGSEKTTLKNITFEKKGEAQILSRLEQEVDHLQKQ